VLQMVVQAALSKAPKQSKRGQGSVPGGLAKPGGDRQAPAVQMQWHDSSSASSK